MSLIVGKANLHDQRFAVKAIDKVTVGGKVRRPIRLGADKGYDSNRIRDDLKERHIYPCLIRRVNNTARIGRVEVREQGYCRQRWKVERSFNWLNNNRRVDRFMEKSLSTYKGLCYLVFIKFYLKKLRK